MRITHHVCPRACGKTRFAENLQSEDPSILLIQRDRAITDIDKFFNNLRGHLDSHNCYTALIVDEFLAFANQKGYSRAKFIEIFVNYMNIQEIILISTPDRLYDKESEKELMLEKFLLEEECVVVKKTNLQSNRDPIDKDKWKQILGSERYKLDIEGEYLDEK